jgi:glycerol uptake facilitator-like aquaporin
VVRSSVVQSAHLEVFAAELIGTAVLVGWSPVILMFGAGSPTVRVVPSEGLRRWITGFCFGTTGALIALSTVGKASGAHITLAVRMERAKRCHFDNTRGLSQLIHSPKLGRG